MSAVVSTAINFTGIETAVGFSKFGAKFNWK